MQTATLSASIETLPESEWTFAGAEGGLVVGAWVHRESGYRAFALIKLPSTPGELLTGLDNLKRLIVDEVGMLSVGGRLLEAGEPLGLPAERGALDEVLKHDDGDQPAAVAGAGDLSHSPTLSPSHSEPPSKIEPTQL